MARDIDDLPRREALVARMAGNIASGLVPSVTDRNLYHNEARDIAKAAVDVAEAVIAEVESRRKYQGVGQIARKFLNYAFADIDYKYEGLTITERQLCTPEEYATLVEWVRS
jgi:predicted transcriptional regulator